MYRFLVCLFFLVTAFSFGQSSEKYNSRLAGFYRAEELFQKEQYSAARYEFRSFINKEKPSNDPFYVKALYYEGVSAINLFNNDGVDLLETFIRNYPETIFKYDVYNRLGNYYYQKKEFDKALMNYRKIKAVDLEPQFRDEYNFKVAYSSLQIGDIERAKLFFAEVKDGQSSYASAATYYYSHIAYTEKNYQVALDGFVKLEQDDNFKKVVPYYIIQIYYLQGKYQDVVNYAPSLQGAAVANEKDLNHLVGDSYYRLGKYDEAVEYFEVYDKLAETTRDDDYQYGFALYKSKMFDKAIKIFDRVTREKDSLSQAAFYHIAESYLSLKNKPNARLAFQKAADFNFNAQIREDGLYNFAVLSYELDINPYNDAIIAFEQYLKEFPNSKRKEDVYQYLVNVYTSTNNYAKAIESLDRVQVKDVKLKKAYQLVSYNYGIELYQKGQYENAIKNFDNVDKYPISAELIAKAKFWSADANYQMKNYSSAIAGYKSFLSSTGIPTNDYKAEGYYNLGYAYLTKGDTISAVETFRTYAGTAPSNKLKLADAYMRIADAYYVKRENEQAVQFYTKALDLNVSNQDQALYYRGMTYGYMNSANRTNKIKDLLNVVNNYSRSKYVQRALYEIGFTYRLVPDYPNALRYFKQLLEDYPSARYEAIIRVEIADIYYKQNNYKAAEQEYLGILEKFGQDTICSSVGMGLQNVYSATKQISKLEQYAAQYPCLNINTLTLENMVYSPAEAAYQAKKYKEAIPLFEEYMRKYPNGFHMSKVLFYIADSYSQTQNEPKAVEYYERILAGSDNVFTEVSAIRAARYYYNSNMYAKAIPFYEKVEHISGDPEVIYNSRLGLMRSNFQTNDYPGAAGYAKLVLANGLVNNTDRLSANYILGKSSVENRNVDDALAALAYVTKNTTTELASEAKFLMAQVEFDAKNYKNADKYAGELMGMKPTYDYWIARGLILQSKVSMMQDNLFQAEQTILSVLDFYPDTTDGVKEEAQAVYNEIMQIKNAPKAIIPQGETVIDLNEGGK